MMEKELKVGIGDMKLSRGDGRIITYALGSCIGITFYDPVTHLGALLHIMLPAQLSSSDTNVFKFADSGIRETLRKLRVFGIVKHRMIVKIAGGAKMFDQRKFLFWKHRRTQYRKRKADPGVRGDPDRRRGCGRKLCQNYDPGTVNRKGDSPDR